LRGRAATQPHGAQKHQKLPPENIDIQSFQEM